MIRTTALLILAGTTVVGSHQSSSDDQRRAVVALMRALNTAESAARATTGRFVPLADLLDHPAMGRVKADIAISNATATHQGATIRLALSTDATQYQVAVVPAETCGWAAFSDERGLIYTGKVLDC